MKLYHLISGPLRVNAYILAGDDNEAAVIDGGESYNALKAAEKAHGLKITAALFTHAHFDHTACAKKLQRDGAKIFIGEKDAPKLAAGDTLGARFGRQVEPCTADVTVKEGDKIEVAGITLTVIETPGHTDGSVTFMGRDMLFTGDTLFLESVGRTDFPTGSRAQLIESVQKLFALPGDYKVYPGHEAFTTLSHERVFNPFTDYD